MNGIERRDDKARKRADFTMKVGSVEKKMQAEVWGPNRIKEGHSKRYHVTIPGIGKCIVALKVMGMSYRGSIGFQRKTDGEWHPPLTNSHFLLYATPYEQGIGVWLFPIPRLIERLEVVQRAYEGRGWDPTIPLWINIFEQPAWHRSADPCQLNFAEGKPPMWRLSLEDEGEAEDRDKPTALPPLAAYSVGQLIDELQRRGLKSFSF
jgi:hypothetical protein